MIDKWEVVSLPYRHWSWPENNDPWALSDELIPEEAWDQIRNDLEHFMHEIINDYNKNRYDYDFYIFDLIKFATVWSKVHSNHFTNSDIYWLSKYAWEKWAKTFETRVSEFKDKLKNGILPAKAPRYYKGVY